MKRNLLLTIALLAGLAGWAFPLKVTGVDTTRTAILIKDLKWGFNLVEANLDTPLIPASVTKAVTVASMLNLASPDERFATPVEARGRIADGVLKGNLVVCAVGDPTIESRYLPEAQGFADSIAAHLKSMGISRVEGRVIVDETTFTDATTAPGVLDEDIVWPYGATLQGANFRDNRFRLSLPSKETSPEVPGITFAYQKGGKGTSVTRKRGSEQFIVRGNAARRFSDEFATPRAAKVMQREIEKVLAREGIEVENRTVTPSGDVADVYTHLSPTFHDIMLSLMHRSDNLMAEGMLRALTPGQDRAAALLEEQAIWDMYLLNRQGVNIEDGSGLSRNNRLTATFLGGVLQTMAAKDFTNDYAPLFPRAGMDGTMKNFLKETALEGRLAMKTGSMKGVQSYAGYLLDEEGNPTHVVVVMANNFKCSRAALKNDIQRLLLEKLSVDLQEQ